jgi:hypothetical protein
VNSAFALYNFSTLADGTLLSSALSLGGHVRSIHRLVKEEEEEEDDDDMIHDIEGMDV